MTNLKATHVAIIEDNPDMKIVLSSYVEKNPMLKVVGAFGSCEEALEKLGLIKPSIVLMDIELPGMNGVEGTKRIKQRFPKADVIIVTVFENSETVFSALRAGASGYLTKTCSEEEVLSAIQECLDGGAPMSMKIAKMVISSFNKSAKSPLTDRETEILSCLQKGKSYNSVADELFISLNTVKYHIKNIYIKLHATSKEEALEIARRKKYI